MTWPRRAIWNALAEVLTMALLQSFLGVMSGKVGGYVFQHNGRVRAYFIPTPSYTTLQLAARNALSAAATSWAAATEALQDAWLAWSESRPRVNRVGQSYVMSSRAAYISLNGPRIKAGIDPIDTPPAIGLQPEATSFPSETAGTIDQGTTTLELTMTGSMALAAGQTMAVYVGSPRSGTSRKARRNLVLAGTIAGAAVPVVAGSVPLPTGTAIATDLFDVKVVIHHTPDLETIQSTFIVEVI